MPERLPFIKKRDIWIISGLLIAAFGFWLILSLAASKDAPYAEIYYDGDLAEIVNLGKARVFSIDRLPQVVFEVKENTIAFISSDCPDKICIYSGRLGYAGQSAACLPNKVALKIRGGADNDEPDVVAR